MGMLPPVYVELKANIKEFTAAMGEARDEVSKVENKGVTSFDKLATFGKAALFGIGTAAVSVGGLSLEMADQFEKSHAKLETAIKNAGSNFEEYSQKIGVAQKSMENYGFTNAQTQEALANLTTALHDPQKALNDLGVAADLAKFKHVDLATAALAVARAQEGNLKPLKQLGIDLPIAAGGAKALAAAQTALATQTEKAKTFLDAHSDALNTSSKFHLTYMQMLDKIKVSQDKVTASQQAGTDVMNALSKAVGGQAAASAETFAGKMQALKAQSEDVAKNIGMALIPIMMKLVGAIKDVVDWFGKHKDIAIAFGVVIGTVLVGAIGAYISTLVKGAVESAVSFAQMIAGWLGFGTAATTAGAEATAAGAEIGVATGGMTIVIGLVAAAALYLATHWKQVWADIKHVISDAWQWIKDVVGFLVKVFEYSSPFGLAIKFLGDHWSEIWNGMKDVVTGVWHFIESIFGKIVDGVKGVVGLFKAEINGLISIVNLVIRAIDAIHVKLPDWIPLIGGKEFGVNIPEIPKLAEGGIVSSPTLAMIGEAGAEAVIPLSKMGSMGGGVNVVIHVQGSVISQNDLVTQVRDQLGQVLRRKGAPLSALGL